MTITREEIRELYRPEVLVGFSRAGLEGVPLEEQLKRMRESVVNSKTHFFRDRHVLYTLKRIVLPCYAADKPVSIASVGCSTGREVYSVLMQNWDRDIRVDGYDINPHNIETAIKGEYELSSVLMDTSDFLGLRDLGRFYDVIKEGGILKYLKMLEEAKEKTGFYVHDILDGPLPEKYDVVLLLNVLKHFTEKGREKILLNVHESMVENGWLLCERVPIIEPEPEAADYLPWMEDLSRFGFEKQPVMIPRGRIEDAVEHPHVYRKTEARK